MVILCFGVTYLNFLEISSRKMSEIAGKRRNSLIYILLFYACLFDSFRKRLYGYLMFLIYMSQLSGNIDIPLNYFKL